MVSKKNDAGSHGEGGSPLRSARHSSHHHQVGFGQAAAAPFRGRRTCASRKRRQGKEQKALNSTRRPSLADAPADPGDARAWPESRIRVPGNGRLLFHRNRWHGRRYSLRKSSCFVSGHGLPSISCIGLMSHGTSCGFPCERTARADLSSIHVQEIEV